MARISRQELKSDEFVSGMDAAYEYYLEHQGAIIAAAIATVVVAACLWGGWAWRNSRNRAAAVQLAAALDTLHEPLLSPGTPAGTTAYASVEQRAQAAGKQFGAVADRYGSTDAGHMARYYLGLAQLDAGDSNAVNTLESAAGDRDATVATLAKYALANYYLKQNRNGEAQALLQQLAGQNSALLPHAVIWMKLADLERDTNPTEAADFYRRLQAEYPDTETAQQAGQQLASLHVPPAPPRPPAK